MSTEAFFGSILPATRVRVLAVFKNGLKNAPHHEFFTEHDDLIASALAWDKAGKNVYHACSTYNEPTKRTGENAYAAKSLWADLDVGETKPYKTKREAVAAILNFVKVVGLAKPTLVDSGNGVHAYFAFTKSIESTQWKRLAEHFAACLDRGGVVHDPSRTTDIASVLRVPQTCNRKDPANPKPVKLVQLGTEEPAKDIYKKLKAYAGANGVIVAEKPKGKVRETNDLIGTPNYPPSVGDVIAQHCEVIKDVAATGGDCEYPVWWASMGVAKHTTDPDTVAEFWTREREATGHEKFDHAKVVAEWPAGPTTCAKFAEYSDKCQSCVHLGKVTSPIQLGTPAAFINAPVAVPNPAASLQQVIPLPNQKPWAFGAQWIIDFVALRARVGYQNGALTLKELDPNGGWNDKPFCNRYWQVLSRIRRVDGTWAIEIGYEIYPGYPHATFLIDSAIVTAHDLLRKEFSARELHIYGGPKSMYKAQEKIMFEQLALAGRLEEEVVHDHMGWVLEDKSDPESSITGEFVLGGEVFKPKQPSTPVRFSPKMSSELHKAYSCAGTLSGWVAKVDRIYNRPGAEPWQFVIAAAFASPLVKLINSDNWHGIPIALDGPTGVAKTSTAMAAMGIYGKVAAMKFNAGERGSGGDTLNAVMLKMNSLRNLPYVMDELTNRPPEDVASVMYMQANGRGADRMKQDLTLDERKLRWKSLSICTSNIPLHEKIKMVATSTGQSNDAKQYRCFQITLDAAVFRSVFHDVTKDEFERELLNQEYGHVGREWAQFLVNNRPAITTLLTKARAAYKIDEDDTSDMRFYADLLATVESAARLAKRKGFIDWDVDAMMHWAKANARYLRDAIRDSAVTGNLIGDFFGSLFGRTIVTAGYSTGPGKRVMELFDARELRATPVARLATVTKALVITASHITDWSRKNNLPTSSMLDALVANGYIKHTSGTKLVPRSLNICSGTTLVRSQAPCYEFWYDKVADHLYLSKDLPAETDGKVVALNAARIENESVTETVTVAGDDQTEELASS